MADNKKYIKSVICTLIVVVIAIAFFRISVCAEERDWVEIVSVTPNSYDSYTDSLTFTATINYSLQSVEKGIVYLDFDTSQSNYYEIDEEPRSAGVVVSRGTGTVVLSKEVTPTNWDIALSRRQQYIEGISYPATNFMINANLSEYSHNIPCTSLATYEGGLTDLPETETSANKSAGYDNWSNAYEDFVLGRLFLSERDSHCEYGDLYGEYDVVRFCLHDMDGDDTPELFIFNGFNGRDIRADYIFSYDGTEIRYCGNVWSEIYSASDYPGIFSTVYMSGYYMDDKYIDKYSGVTYLNHSTLEEYSVVTNRVEITGDLLDGYSETVIFRTDNTELYNVSQQTHYDSFQFMTLAEIEEQGWETFLKTYQEGLEVENTQPAADYKVYCGEGYPNGYEVFDCSLEDCLLKADSATYNPQLAHMLIAMCNSVYDGTDMKETFYSFGFQKMTTSYTTMGGIMLAYSMAKKQIGSVGNEKTIVLVVARGTEDLIEWGSNVHVFTNDKNQHTGFADAANELYDRMTKFLGTSDFSNVEFVITGFSRGAAAANILTARLVDEGVAQSRIHAYTFACPDTARVTTDTVGEYQCIFNIANAKDFVSWVPETLLGDEWNKYGQSYWYCEDWNDYQNLEMGMDAHDQKKYLEYLRSEKLESGYRGRRAAKAALDAATTQRAVDALHMMGYRNTKVVYTGVYCPVDVEILTSDGCLAGSVVGDAAKIILDDKVYFSVDGSRKHIYFLDEDMYTLRLTATDDGMMRYTVQNIDMETQEMVGEKVFSAVSLINGKQMVSSITVGEDGETDAYAVQLFVLDCDGVSIAEIQENGEELPLLKMQGTDIVFVAVVAVSILIGVVIILKILVKRRKYADEIRLDRTIRQKKSHFCPSCGRRASSNTSFCKYCGARISRSIPHRPRL